MPKRQLQGTVVSDKANKTITVLVQRQFNHPVYKKTIRTTKKYAAHDEANQAKIGDIVTIEESKPISKSKKWILVGGAEIGSNKNEKVIAPKPVKAPKAPKAPAAKKEAKEPKEKKETAVKKETKKK